MNIVSGDTLSLEDSEGLSAVVVRNWYDDLGFSYNARLCGSMVAANYSKVPLYEFLVSLALGDSASMLNRVIDNRENHSWVSAKKHIKSSPIDPDEKLLRVGLRKQAVMRLDNLNMQHDNKVLLRKVKT